MQSVRTRLSQYADVRAAVVALGGVVLRGVDGDLLMASGGGVGRAWPIAPYTDVLVWIVPPAPKFSPVLSTKAVLTYLAGGIAVKEVVGADTV